MALNEELTKRVRDALGSFRRVEEKKMFRGITFMLNGKMCVSVGDDEILYRIDPSRHDEAVRKKGARTMMMKGREYRGYVFVKENAIRAKKDFDYWMTLALDFNARAKASVKRKPGAKERKRS